MVLKASHGQQADNGTERIYCKNNMPVFNISKSIEIEIASGLKYNLYAIKLKPQTAFSVSNCFAIRNN